VDVVLQLRCLRELVLEGAREGLDKADREYHLSKGAPNTAMRVLKLGHVFQYDCISALMQVSGSFDLYLSCLLGANRLTS
jgi:hypothetical protein